MTTISQMPSQQAKHWCFTLNNPADAEQDELIQKASEAGDAVQYLVVGAEVGESGTPHLQGFVSFKSRKSFGRVKEFVGERAHLEVARGSPKQAADYCKKDGAFKEIGTCPKGKGARNDLVEIVKNLKEGKRLSDIAEQFPAAAIRYHNGIRKVQALYPPKREGAPQIWVFWGRTGTGKTRRVWEFVDRSKLWVHPGGQWFDGYDGHPAVLFDDFDGSWFKIAFLLRLLDRYEMQVQVKGAHVWWVPKTIYITSNIEPKDWYPNATQAHQAALRRRLQEFGNIQHFQ